MLASVLSIPVGHVSLRTPQTLLLAYNTCGQIRETKDGKTHSFIQFKARYVDPKTCIEFDSFDFKSTTNFIEIEFIHVCLDDLAHGLA